MRLAAAHPASCQPPQHSISAAPTPPTPQQSYLAQDANYELAAATDPTLTSKSGCYFVGGRETRAPAVAYDKQAQQRLWKLLLQQTGAVWSV